MGDKIKKAGSSARSAFSQKATKADPKTGPQEQIKKQKVKKVTSNKKDPLVSMAKDAFLAPFKLVGGRMKRGGSTLLQNLPKGKFNK